MSRRALVAVGVLTLALSAITAPVHAAVTAAAAAQAADNPWLERRVMNMAHSGGEREAPTNTMYAFKRAVALGSEMIELDVQSTKDDQLVVLHNATVDDTTNGTGKIRDLTLTEVRALDAAYRFVPGRGTVPDLPAGSYPLRGVRTGETAPPAGYRAEDFGIATLGEVFAQFPGIPINIEIKGAGDLDVGSFQHNARLLAAFLDTTGRTDVLVTSFNDLAVSTFHDLQPDIAIAPGMVGITTYFFTGIRPIAGTVALQIPVKVSGIRIATPEFIARAHNHGYAVHIWFSGSAPEDAATYNELIDACADALMPALPTLLEQILDDRGIVRPGQPGTDPCP